MDSGLLGAGVENYRGFRYNWTGLPNEVPAIVSLKSDSGTTVYVSWNGDTETKTWRFYSVVDSYGSRQFLGEAERTGFETSLFVKGQTVDAVSADAVGANGHVLVSAGVAKTQAEVLPVPLSSPSSLDMNHDLKYQVPIGQRSQWEEHMILKIDRFHMD
jgi:hypothetical protein